MASSRYKVTLAWVQGIYYAITGIWPLVDIESFQLVTGPKTDLWLVRTVGGLVGVTGLLLLWSARRGRVSIEIACLAAGQALVLGLVSLVYPLREVIAPIYLWDAIAEFALVAAWSVALRAGRVSRKNGSRES